MNRYHMFKLFLGLLLSIPTTIYAQDSASIRREMDIALSIKPKVTRQQIKSEFDSVNYVVAYDKRTGQVISVDEVHHPVFGGKTKWWVYRYHFRQDTIILISKYNNVKIKDPRWQNAYYYFRNNILVYKEETGTSIPDIEGERKKAEHLKKKFSKQ